MQELLLFAQVPSERHHQLLNIIAGISAMQPQRVLERHLIYKPKRKPGLSGRQVGGSQGIQNSQMQALQGQMQGELYYTQLVGEVSEHDFTSPDVESSQSVDETAPKADVEMTSNVVETEKEDSRRDGELNRVSPASAYSLGDQKWLLQFNDLPDVAGRRPVTSRMVSYVEVVEGNAMQFMDKWGYSYVSEYILEGHRFIHHNVIFLLHRILRFPSDTERSTEPRDRLYSLQDFTPVDLSGSYTLQASVRLQDGNKPESIFLGLKELKETQVMMEGVVDLKPGDRLALDTRVKN